MLKGFFTGPVSADDMLELNWRGSRESLIGENFLGRLPVVHREGCRLSGQQDL